MGIFGFGKPKKALKQGTFQFSDGSRNSPEEYGYMAVIVGFNSGNETTGSLFGQGTMGEKLGLSQAVQKIRFASDIYIATHFVGVYIWYAASMSTVDNQIMLRIYKGVSDGYGEIRAPNGSPLEHDFKAFLGDLAKKFAISVAKDIEEGAEREQGGWYPKMLPSTEQLFDVLLTGYTNDHLERQVWRDELSTPAGIWLKHTAEASTFGMMEALQKKLAVRFVAQ